jgi:RHS repeat-associated protein
MSGISSKALSFGGAENKYKFNEGTELNSSFDINLYETNFRSLDPQIGRFHQVDPMSDAFEDFTPYSYANNNPILLNDPFGLASDTTILPNVTVTGKYKTLDSENGQVLPAEPWYCIFYGCGERKWNGWTVDKYGYVGRPGVIAFAVPDVGLGKKGLVKNITKGLAKTGSKNIGKYLVYSAYKKVKGRLTLYIGKAKNSLKNRYTKSEIDDISAQIIEKLDDLPDNATALGVEQAVLELNGGVGVLSNIKNAAAKMIYKDAGLKWLNENIPNWKDVFIFPLHK